MRLGYNTNGLSEHDVLSAIGLLAELGYRSVAITINHHTFNPFHEDWRRQCDEAARLLAEYRMSSVIETGARFLLDPRRKHEPTLITSSAEGRRRRIDFLKHAIDVACRLGSDCVSLWSGVVRDSADDETLLERLANGLREVLEYADRQRVTLAFEPEPGMFIDTTARFERLFEWLDAPQLRMTLDVGHLYCLGEVPLADYIHRCGPKIANVHLEDMRAGVHEHLMFGEGEMDFPPILRALRNTGYRGGVHVELSRHSHVGPEAARQAFDFLSPWMPADDGPRA
ncbi:MAG: sugar phosphate isomerase/epimerase [Pirellulaceae bacterium]|nr:sugar phosphate isomerase/epimerase [Pirellulaceae bacterium]